MDSLCKHKDECIYSTVFVENIKGSQVKHCLSNIGYFDLNKGAMWQNPVYEIYTDNIWIIFTDGISDDRYTVSVSVKQPDQKYKDNCIEWYSMW